jgi:hypothetical protein
MRFLGYFLTQMDRSRSEEKTLFVYKFRRDSFCSCSEPIVANTILCKIILWHSPKTSTSREIEPKWAKAKAK